MGLLSLLILIPFSSHSEMRSSVVAENLSFISEDYESNSKKSFGLIGAELSSDPDSKDILLAQVQGQYAIGQSQLSFLNLRELSLQFSVDTTSDVWIGRKLNNWSQIDESWNLGVIQPQFRWNPLQPENQGLTGLYWRRHLEHVKIKLFGSPLYLPDQGPSFEIKDGQFTSANPWFPNPPQNVTFQNGPLLPIDYNIFTPETSDVIFQSSFGAQLELNSDEGYYAQISGLYKPANQLALGYRVVGVVDRVRVDLQPKVYYETVFASDIGYKFQGFDLVASLVYSKPQSPEFEAQYNKPVFEDSTMGSFMARYNHSNYKFGIGYLDTSGGQVTEEGPDASADRKALSQRFIFRQALLVEMGLSGIFAKNYKLSADVNYKQSTFEPFRMLTIGANLNIRGPWAFWLQTIMIDTDENSDSYFESVKNRDMVVAGVSYDI